MNNDPEFAPFLDRILDNANKVVDENKKEVTYEEAKHKAHVLIGQKQIHLQDLVGNTIKEVHTDYNGFTLVTETGMFVHVTAHEGYEGSVDLDTHAHLEIKDAFDIDILPKDVYDDFKAKEDAYYKRNTDRNARSRLQTAVADLGPAEAQKFFDELKARQDAANADPN
jgi:hypothetical protein